MGPTVSRSESRRDQVNRLSGSGLPVEPGGVALIAQGLDRAEQGL
jgi:hypothetical protein